MVERLEWKLDVQQWYDDGGHERVGDDREWLGEVDGRVGCDCVVERDDGMKPLCFFLSARRYRVSPIHSASTHRRADHTKSICMS